jgi:acyl carrier protein
VSVQEKVTSIVATLVDRDSKEIDPAAQFRADLGITSIDFVELLSSLENEFDLDISDEDAMGLNTVRDTVAFLEARLP